MNTKRGSAKSTNRIDDIIKLTPEGDEYVRQIEDGEKKDKTCWYWVMYCSGEGNSCQHECEGISNCKENCANYSLPNNIKNYHDMHLCKVRVISESKLSWLKKEKPLRIKIIGSHLPINTLASHTPIITRLNLSRQTRDNIIISRRAYHKTAKDIKAKFLAPYNNASENELREALLKNQKTLCDNTKLRSFIMYDDKRLKENADPWRHGLYFTIWLLTPILTFVVENNAGVGIPLAFGLSNRENSLSIQLAVLAVKNNIPCNDNNCFHEWFYEDLPTL
ncbi:unnamed protein product [Rhizophagus irregularis]|nr:unnamed protein product [Rhizophagus irregularis]